MSPDNTGRKQEETLFKPGQSGNPAGRPKGARNKLGEAFLQALQDDFEEHGAEAVVKAREEDPNKYLKVIASLMPKELNVKVNDLDELTDDQIARQLASLAAQLARAGIDFGSGATETIPPQSLN